VPQRPCGPERNALSTDGRTEGRVFDVRARNASTGGIDSGTYSEPGVWGIGSKRGCGSLICKRFPITSEAQKRFHGFLMFYW
jgi:hypothetical protein